MAQRSGRRSSVFVRFASTTARSAGHPVAFGLAAAVVVRWAVTGPVFGFNNTWQLVINTGTTIVTFMMVFLIQNTQNRDSQAMHIKLDELLRACAGAHNALLDLEDLEQADLDDFRERFQTLAAEARNTTGDDTGSPALARK